MARIGTSVFTDICGKHDPMCQSFGFMGDMRSPTPMMANSLLYKMTTQGIVPGVTLNNTLFTEARGREGAYTHARAQRHPSL